VRAIGDDLGEPGGIAVAVGFTVGAEGNLATRCRYPRSGITAGLGLGQAELATWGWQNVTRGIIA
jgi:hypothetical protein